MSSDAFVEIVFAIDMLATTGFALMALRASFRSPRHVNLYATAAFTCAMLACLLHTVLPGDPPQFLYQPAQPIDYGVN